MKKLQKQFIFNCLSYKLPEISQGEQKPRDYWINELIFEKRYVADQETRRLSPFRLFERAFSYSTVPRYFKSIKHVTAFLLLEY